MDYNGKKDAKNKKIPRYYRTNGNNIVQTDIT